MNYERMLISPVICMNYSIYLKALQQLLLHLHAAPGNGRRTGERWDRRTAVKRRECVGVCCVSGISTTESQMGGKGSLREGGCCVWAQGEARVTSQSSGAVEDDRHNIYQVQSDLWGQILGVIIWDK